MQTTALAPQAKPCTNWCANHEREGDICYAADVIVNFNADGPWKLREFGVGLAADITGSTVVHLAVNGFGPEEVTLDGAEQIAHALLAMVAVARRAGAR